jgi:uncharacterized membrane protein YqhA
MKNILEKSRYLSLLAVFVLLLSFGLALLWSSARAFRAWQEIITSYGQSPAISLLLIKLVDACLIAIVLYILAVSIYKLFVGELALPSGMAANSLSGLKNKLGGVIVLVIVVRFVETMFEATMGTIEILWLAVSTALVGGTLIAFGRFGPGEDRDEG